MRLVIFSKRRDRDRHNTKMPPKTEKNPEATIFVGNLDEQADELLIYELFLQVGPLKSVNIPKDRITQVPQGFGFVEFAKPSDVDYAINIMNGISLFDRTLRVRRANPSNSAGSAQSTTNNTLQGLTESARTIDVGANLHISGLDPLIDEEFLGNTFSRFGPLVKEPVIVRDQKGESRGFGFVSFGNFDHSDNAIKAMNGLTLMNKVVKVQYAFKKNGKDRHGDEAERRLARG